MKNKNIDNHEQNAKISLFIVILVLISILIFSLVLVTQFNSQRESEVFIRNGYEIEIIARDTSVTVPITFTYNMPDTIVYLQQEQEQELTVVINFDGIAYIKFFYSNDNEIIAIRRLFFDEYFVIPPAEESRAHKFSFAPINIESNTNNTLTVIPRKDNNINNEILPVLFASPSCLQMAMFAHMAFFPFDFNEGERPQQHNFKPIHFEPFYNEIMTDNIWGHNSLGFNFSREMNGWYLKKVYIENSFGVVLYSSVCGKKTVIALKGSDGNIRESISSQSGTWWCNFRSLAGYRHTHVDSLIDFLNNSEFADIFSESYLYITGHSLGGYLAYVAAHELVNLGHGDNIRRVVAFSAPIFNINTILMVANLDDCIRRRIIHFYVTQDLIAGIIGATVEGGFPGYNASELLNKLLGNMREIYNIDIPDTFYTLSNVIKFIESALPFEWPYHIQKLMWWLYMSFNEDAKRYTQEFYSLIWHESMSQTWHSPRPEPPWPVNIPLIGRPITYAQELTIEILFDMLDRVFDADSHFMMNFYPHLAIQSMWI